LTEKTNKTQRHNTPHRYTKEEQKQYATKIFIGLNKANHTNKETDFSIKQEALIL
jgi:hypothetical protein